MKINFIECDSCRAKPGSPILCSGCLNNRHAISILRETVGEKKIAKIESSLPNKGCSCTILGIKDFDCKQHGR